MKEDDRVLKALRLLDDAHAALIAVDWRSVKALHRIETLFKVHRLVDHMLQFIETEEQL